jgi:hypothetical protein
MPETPIPEEELDLLKDVATGISYLADQLSRWDVALQAQLALRAAEEAPHLRVVRDDDA